MCTKSKHTMYFYQNNAKKARETQLAMLHENSTYLSMHIPPIYSSKICSTLNLKLMHTNCDM